MENGTFKQQTNGPQNDSQKFYNTLSQNQVIESNTDDRISNAVDNALIAVGSRMHGAILTAMNDVVIPRVGMAVRSVTDSSGNRTNGIVQNLDRRDFTGNTENTSLRSASSLLNLILEQDEIHETRDMGNSEDIDIPETKPNYDRRAHTHHKYFCGCLWTQFFGT